MERPSSDHGQEERDPPPAVVFECAGYGLPGGPEILSGIDLAVAASETVVLVGRSGAGKTTALKLVNGLLHPTDGAIRVDGRSTRDWNPVALRRRVGWVIQEIGLFPHMTVARNVGIVPELIGWGEERIRARVDELLAMVGLEPESFARRHPHQLSGGQRQRVGVARALAADPPLLLLDEPFGALDPLTRAELQREFRDLVHRLGKAALFVTHDLHEALALGDRVGLLADGRLPVVASPETFLEADHPDVRALARTLQTPTADGG